MLLGVGWQDCQSSPTRTLHHSRCLHNGGENLHALSPPRVTPQFVPSSRLFIHTQTFHSLLHRLTFCLIHLHAQTSFRLGLMQPGERSRFHYHSRFPPKGIDCVLTRSRNWVWISLTRCVFPLSLLAEPVGSRSATITHNFPVEGHLHPRTVCKFCLLVCGLCVCFSSVFGSLGKSPWWLCRQGWVVVFPCCESRSLIHFRTVNFLMS